MIKLALKGKPDKLTDELVLAKTNEFKADPTKSVWNIGWLKSAIADLTDGKCYFSEIPLGEGSNYMEVEHYLPKSLFPDHVMKWGNLFPACKKCNVAKGEHDTLSDPIVNPFVDNPKDYFYFEDCFYRAKQNNLKAKLTIKVTHINDYKHFVIPRARIYNRVKGTLAEIYDDIKHCKEDRIKVYYKRLVRLMKEGRRTEPYAALVATAIYSDVHFWKLANLFHENKLLDTEFDSLKNELKFCYLG